MKKEPTTDKNYLQMTCLTKDWYLKYIFLKPMHEDHPLSFSKKKKKLILRFIIKFVLSFSFEIVSTKLRLMMSRPEDSF